MQDTPCLTFGLQMAESLRYVETTAEHINSRDCKY